MARYSERSERTVDVANTIVGLLDRGGISAVTMRNVARDVGMILGTLTGHVRKRERMLAFSARDVGRRMLEDLRRSSGQHGLEGLLPVRSHDMLMTLVPGVPEDWRLLHHPGTDLCELGELPDQAELDAFQAALHGIRNRMCGRADRRWDPDRAQRALEAAAFARRSATIASGSEAE
jgi:AcrR family transcriptional regulator